MNAPKSYTHKNAFYLLNVQFICLILAIRFILADYSLFWSLFTMFYIFPVGLFCISYVFQEKHYCFAGLIILLYSIYANYPIFLNNFAIPKDELKSYSGILFEPDKYEYRFKEGLATKLPPEYTWRSRNIPPRSLDLGISYIYLKNDEQNQVARFACDISERGGCFEEIKTFLGLKKEDTLDWWDIKNKNQTLFLKYATIPIYEKGVFSRQNDLFVFEIYFNKEILFSYDYFLDKYKKQKNRKIYFLIYTFISAIIFFILFKKLEKFNQSKEENIL